MFASLLPPSVLGDFAYPQPVELGEGFRLGVASAPAHAEDQLNDAWLEFCRAGHCHAWLDVPRAEERLRLWSEPEVELDIAAALNSRIFRMGVDWSRTAPRAANGSAPACRAPCSGPAAARAARGTGSCACDGVQDFAAVARYREIIQMAHARGMEVMVTLFHHSLPPWVGLQGGWMNGDAVHYFGAWAADLAEQLGDVVDYWAPMNEPAAFALFTYVEGNWPYGQADGEVGAVRRRRPSLLHARPHTTRPSHSPAPAAPRRSGGS